MRKLILLTSFLASLAALAIGPSVRNRILVWTPSPGTTVSGYWLYWRTPSTLYVYTNRFAVSPNVEPLDLTALALPPGEYVFAMAATNAVGNESSLSNELAWNSIIPDRPTLTNIKP